MVGGRDGGAIEVPDPARLMDFERFAEAGCRGMGFAEWEFVDAYAANRSGSLAIVAEAQPVSRTIIAYMRQHEKGFVGPMAKLYAKLEAFREGMKIAARDWPKSPTKLSSELARVRKPLAAVGIEVVTSVDRRSEKGGTQRDVVITWRDGEVT